MAAAWLQEFHQARTGNGPLRFDLVGIDDRQDVSVVVPTRNRSALLPMTLRSVLASGTSTSR